MQNILGKKNFHINLFCNFSFIHLFRFRRHALIQYLDESESIPSHMSYKFSEKKCIISQSNACNDLIQTNIAILWMIFVTYKSFFL